MTLLNDNHRIRAMNELAILIAFLAGNTFTTDCVQTNLQTPEVSQSGYAVDSMSFAGGGKTDDNELLVSITRKMYADSKCAGEVTSEKSDSGRVKFGKDSETFFWPPIGVKRFDAQWDLASGKTSGSIGIKQDKKEVVYSLSSHMLPIIPLKAQK